MYVFLCTPNSIIEQVLDQVSLSGVLCVQLRDYFQLVAYPHIISPHMLLGKSVAVPNTNEMRVFLLHAVTIFTLTYREVRTSWLIFHITQLLLLGSLCMLWSARLFSLAASDAKCIVLRCILLHQFWTSSHLASC